MTAQDAATLGSLLSAAGLPRVLTAEDPGYAAELAGFNTAVVHRPDAVVTATSEKEVRDAVAVAASVGVPVVALGRGHGFAAPVEGGLVITTHGLSGVTVDAGARTATVGAGTAWSAVLEAAAPYGLAPLAGSAPHVGVVGYLLGGGLGPVARTFGFAADHVRSFRVVTGLGGLVTVSAVEHPDLFWALRGGKGGLGIVTEATIDLFPLPSLHGGGLFFAAEDAATVVHRWVDWTRTLPDSVSTSVALLRLPPLPQLPEPIRGRTVAHVRVAVVDTGVDTARLLAPLREAAAPVLDTVAEMPYAALGSIHADPVDPMPVVEGGRLLREFDHDTAVALLAAVGPRSDVPLAAVEVRLLGGALARFPVVPNAVGGRDAAFSLHVVGAPVPELLPVVVPRVIRGLFTALAPWTGGVQANFHGSANDPAELATAWPDAVRARLRAVRAQYDPQGRFPYDGHR